MKMYEVVMLPLAEQDIEDNIDYIFYEKQAPETALKLAEGLKNTIEKLDFMLESHEVDEDEELAEIGIRKCYYKNYKIYFYVDKQNIKVFVLRVLHMLVDAKPLLLKLDF